MNSIYINEVSLVAPGLYGWKQSQNILSGKKEYIKEDLPKFSASILPANERRRTTPLIKIALHSAEECIGKNIEKAKDYSVVFASSDGDHIVHDKICTALTLPEHPV